LGLPLNGWLINFHIVTGAAFTMSIENANRFLNAVAQDEPIRAHFAAISCQEDFLLTAQDLGYFFTAPELAEAIAAHSQGILYRRTTGVWRWLRSFNWPIGADNLLRADRG
jgi:predicted ribosomally synthesized peptide with nif11-like leader